MALERQTIQVLVRPSYETREDSTIAVHFPLWDDQTVGWPRPLQVFAYGQRAGVETGESLHKQKTAKAFSDPIGHSSSPRRGRGWELLPECDHTHNQSCRPFPIFQPSVQASHSEGRKLKVPYDLKLDGQEDNQVSWLLWEKPTH